MKTTIGNKLHGVVAGLGLLLAVTAVPLSAHAEEACGDLAKGHYDEYNHGECGEKHLQKLHDTLKLTGNQEGAWKSFTQQAKPAEPHAKFDRAEFAKLSTPERLDRMLANTKERQARFESHVQAVKSFYNVLSPEQRKIFDDNFRSHWGRHAGWSHEGQHHHEKPELLEKN